MMGANGILKQFSLPGRNAIVTGGSRNMGRRIAIGLAEAGANVAIMDLPAMSDTAADTMSEIESLGRNACFVPFDIRDLETIPVAVAEAVNRLGPLHVLVNNAGKTDDVRTPAIEYEPEAFDDHYYVMVRGTFFMSQAVARHMIEQGTCGRIVNVSSRVGIQPARNASAYCTSKAAVAHMTRLLALELGPHGIRVNAIGPGPIPRPEAAHPTDRHAPPPFLLARALQFEDIPGTVLYLASDASSMVTGQLVVIDGGLGLQPPV